MERTRDDRKVGGIGLEGEGSSVIAFRRSGKAATLLLNWRYYSERRSGSALYGFEFEEMTLTAERQEAFI